MLKVLRDNLKYLSWVLWLVIVVFILFVFVDFGSTVQPQGSATAAAATVGGQEISYADFENAFRRTEDIYRQAYGEQWNADLARQLGLHQQVMNTLVADRILLSEASDLGIEVTDQEVRREILEFAVFKDDTQRFVGEEEYSRILRANGLTASDFEASVRSQMLTDKVKQVLAAGVFISDAEVEESYRRQVERAKIRFVRLDAERFADQATLDQAALAAHFDEHTEDFMLPERRSVDYLLVDRNELLASLQVSDSDVEQYYNDHQDEFTAEEQVNARHILVQTNDQRSEEEALALIEEAKARIENGADFATVAAEVSDDPGSKANGGDLGLFGRGRMVKPFEEAAFAAPVGGLVGPVRTDFGFHLIEVLAHHASGAQPLDQVAEPIRSRLLSERAQSTAEATAQDLVGRIRSESLSSSEQLASLADGQTGVSFTAGEPFAEDENVAGIGRSTAFTVAAYGLEPGAVSEAVKIGRGWAILALRKIEEPRKPLLDEVRSDVEDSLRQATARGLATTALMTAAEQLRGGQAFDDVAAELGVEVEDSVEFGAGGPIGSLGRQPQVASAALALEVGATGGPIQDDSGSILFEVVQRSRFDAAEFAARRDETRDSLENQRYVELLGSWLNTRRAEMGVRYDPQILDTLGAVGEG